MATAIAPDSNRLFARIIERTGAARLVPLLERVRLKTGQVLHEPGVAVPYVYFPVTALVSLLQVMRSGHVAETAVIGNDGMVGTELLTGANATQSRAVVQCDGYAYRVSGEQLAQILDRYPQAQQLVLNYAGSIMAQAAQTAACNRHHALNQQLCSWLLMSLDRVPADELRMTHETLANMLGVRRESVTLAASRLRQEGAIAYSRGRIKIVDRARLEKGACECYDLVRRECERLSRAAVPQRPTRASVLHRTDESDRIDQTAATLRSDELNNGHRFARERRSATGERRRIAERRKRAERRTRAVPTAFAERRAATGRRARFAAGPSFE